MSIKLTVNDMSKVAGITGRNLRYYDDIGLFKASGILDNGYRYYTIDKVEEIHLINYLRHMGVSIKEIKKHMENRNIDEYEQIMEEQLEKVNHEIDQLQVLKQRISRRITSLEYIRNLPPAGKIVIQYLQRRRILEKKMNITQQSDWELTLAQLQTKHDLPPSMFIGDLGFFVDMKCVQTRGAEDFSGMFFLADDPYYSKMKTLSFLPAGRWLTLYVKGDHHEARKHYDQMLAYAEKENLRLGDTALERTVIDHYISSDPNFYITEIQIPILSNKR